MVAIDIDGTLGDYHGHFLKFAEGYLGQRLPNGWEYRGIGKFADAIGVSHELYREVKLAYRQGGLKRTMPLMDRRIPDWISDLRAQAEVYLTTTRPYLRLDNVDPDTREWLARNGITYDGLLYDRHKYRVLSEIVDPARVVAVLDDLPEQIEAAERQFPEAGILRINRWNSGANLGQFARLAPRAEDLMKAFSMILKRTYDWETQHA